MSVVERSKCMSWILMKFTVLLHNILIYTHLWFSLKKKKETALSQELFLSWEEHNSLVHCGPRQFHTHQCVKTGQKMGRISRSGMHCSAMWLNETLLSHLPLPIWVSTLPRCGCRHEVKAGGGKQKEFSMIVHRHLRPLSPYWCHVTNPFFKQQKLNIQGAQLQWEHGRSEISCR